jgi:hypothetical protein
MSLLRELVDESAFRENAERALLNAALLVRRSGLEHLVTEASHAEVLAMAQAGEILAKERVAQFLSAVENVPGFLAEFDGGARAREVVMDAAIAFTRSLS